MKNVRSILIATFAVLVLATAAQAQTTNVRATIPFPFVVGDRAYAPGEYSLKTINGGGPVVMVDNAEGIGEPTLIMSHVCRSSVQSENTKLVFHRMGNNLFLYQIWTAGDNTGREFPRSHSERMLAQNHEHPETVIVAANISH